MPLGGAEAGVGPALSAAAAFCAPPSTAAPSLPSISAPELELALLTMSLVGSAAPALVVVPLFPEGTTDLGGLAELKYLPPPPPEKNEE